VSKPVLHLVGIFHTQHTLEYSHCAFTGKALRFSKMVQPYGYKVIEYANEGSESLAQEKVPLLAMEELQTLVAQKYPKRRKIDFHGDLATLGTPWHAEFEKRLIAELKKRVQPGDIICHPFGHAHAELLNVFPHNPHVETGIGYPTTMPKSFKIFESYAWRHFHCGKDGRQGSNYEWVIPNYFELDDWVPSTAPGQYYAFLGRISTCKGLDTIYEIAHYVDKKIVLCGQGDHSKWRHPNIEYWGPISGTARSTFMRNAICSLMPTQFIEPFGGSGVEGLLCGTPLITTDYGAFTETVQHGFNGYRCKTLRDWLEALDCVDQLDRQAIATAARGRYSLQTCGEQYDHTFQQIADLSKAGWYELPEKFLKRKKSAASAA
jgi:glycosyltransferase involved in cell wall biosynthesis